MSWSILIARVGGTAVRLHLTFFLFLLWIGLLSYLQAGWAAAAGGMLFLVLLFLCVVLHEFGHIAAARRFGVRTPEIVLLPIGGISRLERIPEQPRQELLIALAGPAVTLVLAAILVLVLGGLPDPRMILAAPSARTLLAQLALANITLFFFNLVPAFPLDGGRVLRALLAARMGHLRGTQVAANIGKGAAILFGLVGLAFGNILLVLIAFFIFIAAGAEAGQVQLRSALAGVPARDVMITHFESLAPGDRVADAAEALIRTSQREFPVVDGSGALRGVLTRDGIIKALADKSRAVEVREVMQTDVPTISERHRLDDALGLLQRGDPVIAVTGAGDRLVGLITWENLAERLMITRAERGKGAAAAPPPVPGRV